MSVGRLAPQERRHALACRRRCRSFAVLGKQAGGAGRRAYPYRAVDQHGQVIDVLLSARRDLAAVRRFCTRALQAGTIPAAVTTDRAPAYPRVPGELIPPRCLPSSGMRTTRPEQITAG